MARVPMVMDGQSIKGEIDDRFSWFRKMGRTTRRDSLKTTSKRRRGMMFEFFWLVSWWHVLVVCQALCMAACIGYVVSDSYQRGYWRFPRIFRR